MSENIKLTEQELVEVRLLQEKFQTKNTEIGQFAVYKMEMSSAFKEQEDKFLNDWRTLQKMENELIDKLLKKYGEGSLDLTTGTFVKEKQ